MTTCEPGGFLRDTWLQSSPTWLIPTWYSPLPPPLLHPRVGTGNAPLCSTLARPNWQAAPRQSFPPASHQEGTPVSERPSPQPLLGSERPANHSPSSSSLAAYIVQCVPLPRGPGQGLARLLFCHLWGGRRIRQPAAPGVAADPAREESGEGACAGGPVWLMLLSPGPSWPSLSPLWLSLPVHTLSPHPDCLSPERLSAVESGPATLLKWLQSSFTALHVWAEDRVSCCP